MSWRRLLVGDAYKGHRLDIRRRESSINQQLTFESKLLRCPEVQEIRENSALFSRLLQRTRKSWTGWRSAVISNSQATSPTRYIESKPASLAPHSVAL